jgi:hypothetical protein
LPRRRVISSATPAAIITGRIEPMMMVSTDGAVVDELGCTIAPMNAAESSNTASTSRKAPIPQRCGGGGAGDFSSGSAAMISGSRGSGFLTGVLRR